MSERDRTPEDIEQELIESDLLLHWFRPRDGRFVDVKGGAVIEIKPPIAEPADE